MTLAGAKLHKPTLCTRAEAGARLYRVSSLRYLVRVRVRVRGTWWRTAEAHHLEALGGEACVGVAPPEAPGWPALRSRVWRRALSLEGSQLG